MIDTKPRKHFDDMNKVKGVPYDVVDDKAIVYEEGKEPVVLDLVLGRSTYQIVYAHLFQKGRGKKPRTIGNFTFEVEDDILTVFRKDGSVLDTKELITDSEVRYPRRYAINLVLETLE